MAAVTLSCGSGAPPPPSAQQEFVKSRSRCEGRAIPSVASSKSGECRGFPVFAGGRKAGGPRSLSEALAGGVSDFAASSGRTINRRDGTVCSSSSSWGSGGSSFVRGDCRYKRGSVRSSDVLPSSAFSSRRKSGRRQRNGRDNDQGLGYHCGVVRSRAQEEAAIVKEIADLSDSLLNLKGVVTTEYRAIGPEMRGRVERLYDRAVVLRQSADRAITTGSRIPTQLTANLIALQREHGSLENIVRLAMEASPALANLEAAVGRYGGLSDAASNLLFEEAKPKEAIFQSLVRQSAVEPAAKGVPASPKYVMSAPASQGSSPLAAFRAEIERRVIEQLSGKKRNKQVTSAIAEELPLSEFSLPASQSHPSDGMALAENQTLVRSAEAPEPENEQLSALTLEESVGTVTLLESKLKELELGLAKSIPLHVFERKVETLNSALSDARAEVEHLTSEIAEKEAILAAVRKDMLAEQDQLTQKVRELTGDLEKMYTVEDIENAVNFGLADLEKELEDEQDRAFLLSVELEKKEKFIVEQQENWRIMKEELEQNLQKEQDRTLTLSLELEAKEKVMIEQEDIWKLERNSLLADLESKDEMEQQLQSEQDRALSLRLELETKKKQMIELEELWKVEKGALEADLKSKEETEQQLQKEQDRALSIIVELEAKEKQIIEQEELWKVEKVALATNLKSIQVKLQDTRKKRTKERAQLAEKKQKVKLLEQELKRLQESMEEVDRIRLQKKEATYATVRMLITQMVQSSRARADSEAHASTLVEEVAKLQEENQTLEHFSRAAGEKAGQAEIEIEGIKASLAKVGREVASLQGELPLVERAAALEKFFGIMAQLIQQESQNMEDSSFLDNDLLEYAEDEEFQSDIS